MKFKRNKVNSTYNQSNYLNEQENFYDSEVDKYLRSTENFGNSMKTENEAAGKIKNRKIDFKQSFFDDLMTHKFQKTVYGERQGYFKIYLKE
jgi:hypothetical protein